ncbi:nucleotidyltransferase family protein [Saccharicrinis aurantiacus]|uniref:nucleotidyltransferase family protein n=1 Tax=Saccharicrinis aurantiacus TaxID=1849719 RepID=UPI00094FDBA3|nr:nucleotidyltransferase domain-containing protein [Saccharicrinis aurantiacus]
MQAILVEHITDLKKLCKTFKIKRLHAFGSVVEGNFTQDSDIDLLIAFSDELSIEEYADNYFALHYKLKDLLKREIDLVTERTLSNPYFIESINETKELIYEA